MATPPPDDLPRSPTGRIPQWVVDEARGTSVDAPGFRAYGAPDPLVQHGSRRPSRARRWLSALVGIAVVAGLVLVSQNMSSVSMTGSRHPVNGPMPGQEEAAEPLGAPPMVSDQSGSFRFQAMQDDGTTPVTWSPCRPIHYVVRTLNQPAGGDAGIATAIGAVSAATGLRFVSDGTTSEAASTDRQAYQPDLYGDRWAPVLIAWATPTEVPDFGVDIAGEAGAVRIGTESGDETFVSGSVYLDPAKYEQIVAEGGRAAADAVILHELGHLVGLDHVTDADQVMFPRSGPSSPTGYQSGDLTGLSRLGEGACQPDA